MDDLAYIALGSNIGDRARHLGDARERIALIPNTVILAQTEVEETDPVGPIEQRNFLNQMLVVQTSLNPRELLTRLQQIEFLGGRERNLRWGPRTIDLDIVQYANTTWDEPDLRVPHIEIHNRKFWSKELAELKEKDVQLTTNIA